MFCVFFQVEDGIRYLVRSRGLGDVYKRQVLAYPDLSPNSATYYEWKERAEAMKPLFASIHVADILEAMATAKDMEEGLDIGDHLLRSDVDTPKASTSAITTESAPPPPILSRAEGGVERMAAKNPSINLLVELLQLDGANATVYQWKQHLSLIHISEPTRPY